MKIMFGLGLEAWFALTIDNEQKTRRLKTSRLKTEDRRLKTFMMDLFWVSDVMSALYL
jgi:hypothetical protein